MFIIDTTCFDESFLFHVITANVIFYTNKSLPRGLVQSPCCCVLSNKCFERSPNFMSVVSTIILKFTIKLLLLKFSQKIHLLIAFLLHSLFCKCSTFFFINGICKTQNLLEGMFFIKTIIKFL